jgi:hypothetical protein
MALYTLCVQPFLNLLEQRLSGVRIGHGNRPVSVVAYEDDVTIFITSISELHAVEDAIRLFEKASEARVNPTKSQALPIGRWATSDTVFGIAYRPCVRILGVQFWSTIHRSVTDTWTHLTDQVRTLARESYPRDLCLAHRIRYVHTYLLAKIWYVAQIFPAPSLTIQHLTSAVTYFLWRGAIFRISIATLRACKMEGGWGLIDVAAKCKALFLSRLHAQGTRCGSATAAWLRFWVLIGPFSNPPNVAAYPIALAYVRDYVMDMAYISPPTSD